MAVDDLIEVLVEPFKEMSPLEFALSFAFPPRLPDRVFPPSYVRGEEPENLGDGIVWKAYDVRATGIERHCWEMAGVTTE